MTSTTPRVHLAYFSPTWTTRAVLRAIALGMDAEVFEHDVTPFSAGRDKMEIPSGDFVVFGAPVYGGRIPAPAAEKFANFSATGAPAAIVAVYGNRAYDDALLELSDLAGARGFRVIAAAAFIGEHSFSAAIATGRPDDGDKALAKEFGAKIRKKLASFDPDGAERERFDFGGDRPYREFGGVPFKPHAGDGCTRCGECAPGCPAGAIPADNPKDTDAARCISCVRCIKVCPVHARSFVAEQVEPMVKRLEEMTRVPKQPAIFL